MNPLRPIAVVVLLASSACTHEAASTSPSPMQAVHQRKLTAVRFEPTPERRERGRYLANSAAGCVLCHSERDRSLPGAPPVPGREFAGAVVAEEEGYRLVAPNLTSDVETGAGGWSDDMLARAIREGVGHDGRGIGGMMWWWALRSLSDEDLASIIVYLRSLSPVRNQLPARLLSREREEERAEEAMPLEAPVPAPPQDDPLERGRYLIEIADCGGCHGSGDAKPSAGAFSGGNRIERLGEKAFSSNITPDPTGIGGYSEEIFVGVMRGGRGGTLHAAMPWIVFRNMAREDLGAIYQALRQVNPVAHLLSNREPPTPCAVCGQEHGFGERNVAAVIERAKVDLGPLEDYVGVYRHGSWEIEVTARDGALYALDQSENGDDPIELIPVEGGRFRGVGLPSPISFERAPDGRIAALFTSDLGPGRWQRVP